MGDGTGCDNMTAVIAKLKPGAFGSSSVAASVEVNDKRPSESDVDGEQPLAKKAKTCSEKSTGDNKTEPATEACETKEEASSPAVAKWLFN